MHKRRRHRWTKPDPRKKPNFYDLTDQEKVVRTLANKPIPTKQIPEEQGWKRYPWSDPRSNPMNDIQYYMHAMSGRRGGKTWTMKNASSRQSSGR